MTAAAPTLSVILSCYNEAPNIPELVRRLRVVLRTEVDDGVLSSYEMVFVDDASTDGTQELIKAELASGDVRLVEMSRRFGVSPCVIAGFKHASGDLLVYMDSDLQDPPELIHDMLVLWGSEPEVDVVNTVRVSRQGEKRLKLLLTKLGYRAIRATTNVPFLEDAGDFKLLSRRVVEQITLPDEALPFIRGLVYWAGFKQLALPYHRQARPAGRSNFPVIGSKVISNFLFSALISFSSAPLIISILAGVVMALISTSAMIYGISEYIFAGKVTSGWTSLFVAVTLLSGIQLLTTGINGLYMNSIFLESKGRPRYIVKETQGFHDHRVVPDRGPVRSLGIRHDPVLDH